MHMQEIQQRFGRIQYFVGQAAQACEADGTVPQNVKERLGALYQEVGLTRQSLQSDDENRWQRSIAHLEQLGDDVERACLGADDVNEEIKKAVILAHTELSDLKHHLH